MEFVYRKVQLLLSMRSHKAETDKGILRRYCRRNYGIYEHAFFKNIACNAKGSFVVTDKEGNNGGRSITNFKP